MRVKSANKPINVSINIKKRNLKTTKKYNNEVIVSVITCTNRPANIKNVFENYKRQDLRNKELIIILNNNSMDIKIWKEESKKYKNVSIFQIDERKSLGSCLNFAVKKSKGAYIAKFDDDDYYGRNYLTDILKAFKSTNAGMVGKATTYVYFEGEKILALRNPGKENRYINYIDGPTMVIKRNVFNSVKFSDVSRGEDKKFCLDCLKKGIKIYSTNKKYHVYIRHPSPNQHSWSIDNKILLDRYKILKRNVTDYSKHIN